VKLFDLKPSETVQLTEHWTVVKDGDPVGLTLYERHYSCYQYKDGRQRKLFCGPGFKIVLLKTGGDALFVWRKFIDASGQQGINCSVFRNESDVLSSSLILEAERVSECRWPGERMYTYVNGKEVNSRNPGFCFHQGWLAEVRHNQKRSAYFRKAEGLDSMITNRAEVAGSA